jgi:hypothetical protein
VPESATADCDRCFQPKPLEALFAFTYGPQPWDATEYTAILCVPCHSKVAEQVERIESLVAEVFDGDPRLELEFVALEAALHNSVLGPGKVRAAAREASQ